MTAAISKSEQSERTRAALLNVASGLFAERGYADTSTQDIVERAGVTRGALYYHFRSKKGIFQAVFERVREARVQRIRVRMEAAKGDLWQRLIQTGCAAFIENSSDKGSQRILYLDGPSILEAQVWHGNVPAVTLIRQTLERLVAEGLIRRETPCEMLSSLLWGSFLEAGMSMALSNDVAKTQRKMGRGLEYLFGSLRAKPVV